VTILSDSAVMIDFKMTLFVESNAELVMMLHNQTIDFCMKLQASRSKTTVHGKMSIIVADFLSPLVDRVERVINAHLKYVS